MRATRKRKGDGADEVNELDVLLRGLDQLHGDPYRQTMTVRRRGHRLLAQPAPFSNPFRGGDCNAWQQITNALRPIRARSRHRAHLTRSATHGCWRFSVPPLTSTAPFPPRALSCLPLVLVPFLVRTRPPLPLPPPLSTRSPPPTPSPTQRHRRARRRSTRAPAATARSTRTASRGSGRPPRMGYGRPLRGCSPASGTTPTTRSGTGANPWGCETWGPRAT